MLVAKYKFSALREGFTIDKLTVMNDAVADLFAIATSGILYALIDLTSSGWSRRRIVKKLRELVVSACLEPLPQRPSRLETRARDLVQRLDGGHREANVQDKQVIDCLLSTLEIGRAVIALRDQMNEVDDIAIKLQIAACLKRLAELYTSPSRRNQIDALNSINHAASALENSMLVTKLPQFTQHQLLTMLHFIRCALLDNDAVLPPHNPNATSREGAVYAA